jgi:hypothetical protein
MPSGCEKGLYSTGEHEEVRQWRGDRSINVIRVAFPESELWTQSCTTAARVVLVGSEAQK